MEIMLRNAITCKVKVLSTAQIMIKPKYMLRNTPLDAK